ncbi:nuclear transport factor 2 family protein [Flavobacterium gawalongense]|nr:nuclear transport factor 2 family protein [Flavobacterium gawalongense]
MKINVKKIIALALCLTLGTSITQAQVANNSNNNLKTTKMTAKEVVEAYSIALSKGDIPTAFSYFSPNAKWHQPGNNKFSGTKTGLDAIGKMLGDMMGATQGSLAIKPAGAMMANGNFVSCPVRFSAKSGAKSVDMNGNDLYEVADGKIVQVWLFSEDQSAEDEFWK